MRRDFDGSKSKILVYNKNYADPHFEMNGMDVSTCEKTIHLRNVLRTTNMFGMVFDGINNILQQPMNLLTFSAKCLISAHGSIMSSPC